MSATRAWMFLVTLSVGSTLIAASARTGLAVSLVILALAWLKARTVLRVYLGLAKAPAWARGFTIVLAGYMLLAMALVAMADAA